MEHQKISNLLNEAIKLSEISRTFRAVDPNADPAVYQKETANATATFQIINAKLYV